MAFTFTPKEFTPGTALTAGLVSYYTAPGDVMNVCSIIKEIILCNTDVVARTVTIAVVPSGGALSVGNTIINVMTLNPNQTKILTLSKVMPPGSFITGLASLAAVVSLTVSGIEVTQ